jgi:hypothetical protein
VATFDYNPITGQLDLVGGGASYIDGVVADSSLLPVTLGTPALDAVYLAKVGSGVWLLNRKPAGLYVRVANNGVAADWTYLGAFPEVNSSANWSLYDGTTPSKELKFDLSGITTGTTRTLTVPNASGTIARTEDFAAPPAIGNTTPAAISGTTGTFSGNVFSAGLNQVNGANAWLGMAIGPSVGPRFAVYNGKSLWRSNDAVGWNNADNLAVNSVGDLFINRDAANTLAQRNGTNAQEFRVYNTFTDASNHERGFLKWSSNVFQIGTEKGSGGGSARALEFQTDGVTRLTIATGGGVTLSSSSLTITGPSSNAVFATSGSGVQLTLRNITTTSTSSCAGITLTGDLTASTRNIVTDTTTGTKIGTATTQKIGFFNATPVVQQAAVADATDAASTQDRLNDLLARLRTLGLIAT